MSWRSWDGEATWASDGMDEERDHHQTRLLQLPHATEWHLPPEHMCDCAVAECIRAWNMLSSRKALWISRMRVMCGAADAHAGASPQQLPAMYEVALDTNPRAIQELRDQGSTTVVVSALHHSVLFPQQQARTLPCMHLATRASYALCWSMKSRPARASFTRLAWNGALTSLLCYLARDRSCQLHPPQTTSTYATQTCACTCCPCL